jgi:hypothetical protein
MGKNRSPNWQYLESWEDVPIVELCLTCDPKWATCEEMNSLVAGFATSNRLRCATTLMRLNTCKKKIH